MPTKRRIILFLIVLAIMVLVKYVVGQDVDVGWYQQPEPSLEDYIQSTMLAGIFWGGIVGIARVRGRNIAARRGEYFSGDLVCLNL